VNNQGDKTPEILQHEAARYPVGESGCGGAAKEQEKALKAKCLHGCSNCKQKAEKAEETPDQDS